MDSHKIAVLTGARGQDASYLAELLLSKGYKVVAMERRSSSPDYSNIKHLFDNPNYILEQGDVTDFGSIARVLKQYKPNEFYNLAAQSFVAASWDQSIATCDVNFTGVCNCLEAIRLISPRTKFLQASTSEVYGDVIVDKQDEDTIPRPRSPYGAAKFGAESLVKVYKESYGLFACFSRSFNHESPRRGKQFVTRKVTDWIGRSFNQAENAFFAPEVYDEIAPDSVIPVQTVFELALKNKAITPLKLGNLKARRDWMDARDTVYGMYLMLQQDTPDDYVFASGTTRTIKELLDAAFSVIGITDWKPFVETDQKLYRPAEVDLLCGNAAKAETNLGWKITIPFDQMIKEMVSNDIELNTNI
jgi:GDPmannose 4,6-dehydratase